MRNTIPLPRSLHLLSLALLLASAGLLPACAARESAAAAKQPDGSPFAKTDPDEATKSASQADPELRSLTDSLDTRTAERRPFAARPRTSSREAQVFDPPAEAASAADQPAPPAPTAPASTTAARPEPTATTTTPPERPAERRERLIRELTGTLAEQPRPASALDAPIRNLLLASAGVGPDDQPAAQRSLEEQAAALRAAPGLSITQATLARRVTGFGQLTAFSGSNFLVGRAHTVLVYVEVDRFAHRAVSPDETPTAAPNTTDGTPLWSVELAQELHLYHDADGLLAWKTPEQNTRDLSLRQRRDHYLVQRVELPANLSVGAYRLKVIVRDRVADAVAEATIPIQIVADPALVSR